MTVISHSGQPTVLSVVNLRAATEIKSIQVLRALAALAVVVYHVPVIWTDTTSRAPHTLWENGSAGVDLFFLISGVIMVLSSRRLLKDPSGWRRFIWFRLVRVVPLYWLATTVKIIAISFSPSVAVHNQLTIWRVVASFLFIPSRGFGIEVLPILSVGWTLSFEMLFYMSFAFALFWLIEPLVIVVPIMIALALASFAFDVASPAVTALANPLVLEFVAGMLIAHLYDTNVVQKVPRTAIIIAGLAGLVCLSFVPTYTSWARVGIWGIAASLTVGATMASSFWLDRFVPSWLVKIGEASYSLYLTHGFVLPICFVAITQLHLRGNLANMTSVFVSLAVTTTIALVTHRFVELPLSGWLKKFGSASRGTVSQAVA